MIRRLLIPLMGLLLTGLVACLSSEAQFKKTVGKSDLPTSVAYMDEACMFTQPLAVVGIADGALGSYDLKVGDVVAPDYGIIRFGDGLIGRTSYNVGSLDLDGSVILRNMGTPTTSNIEFVFTESGGGAIRFALAKSAAGNATYNPRSMIIAGPAVNNDAIVTVGYWQTNNSIFDNLAMDTAVSGADVGIQNDLEVEGDIFTDSIKESTSGVGVTIDDDLYTPNMKTGTTQALAGAAVGELWADSDDGYAVKLGQ